MRIIQTLWLAPKNDNAINSKCGWLSPEYHWMSWVLCFSQLHKFYSQIELYTNKAGKEVLIDILKLPYSKVHLVFDDLAIPESLWVYYKIYTYSLQKEPFLHVDGDVFIYKKLPQKLLNSPLISQNQEINFTFYQKTLDLIRTLDIDLPIILKDTLPELTYNAGIFGGHDIAFFQEYSQLVLDFISKNFDFLQRIPQSNCAMLLEQGIFSVLVAKHSKVVTCVLDKPISDITYPELTELHETKAGKWYFHLMNETKRNRFYLKLLSCKLRQEYAQSYYYILKKCQENGIVLDFKIYQIEDLSPLTHNVQYYDGLLKKFNPKKIDIKKDIEIDWTYFYAKDSFIYNQVEYFQSLSIQQKEFVGIIKNEDFYIEEKTVDSEIAQSIIIKDTFSLENTEIEFEAFEIIILSIISMPEAMMIKDILEELGQYFDEEDFKKNRNTLYLLLLEKINRFLFLGIIRCY